MTDRTQNSSSRGRGAVLRQRVVTALRLAALLAAIPMLLAAAARPAAAQVVLQITNPLFPLTPVGQQVT